MSDKNPVDNVSSSVSEKTEKDNTDPSVENTNQETVPHDWESEKNKILAKQREILDEKKRIQDEYNKLKESQKKQEEEKLKEQERYKELADKREKELAELKNIRETEMNAFKEAKKMNAFLKEIGGLKQEKYQNLVDLDKVILGSDGTIDEGSLKDYVSSFKTEYPELIKTTERKENLPPQTATKNTPPKDFHGLSFKEMMQVVEKSGKLK